MALEGWGGDPLILTLKMDAASQERFDALRRAHFPPERNYLSAHLTLFHHLPGDQADDIVSEVEEASNQQEPMVIRATGILFLGRGVAFGLRSRELEALRRRLAQAWERWLTAQDRQKFRPHVTVQNKVTPEIARSFRDELQSRFTPFEVGGDGLALWRYVGGPWEPVGVYPFRG